MRQNLTSPRILVTGSTGMLGQAVTFQLRKQGMVVIESSRQNGTKFDAETGQVETLFSRSGLSSGDFVVNCVGLTKSHINDASPSSVERAVRLNVLFPIALAAAAADREIRVIQVATDCVFSGTQGAYTESSSHDAVDSYGKSKSLGEVQAANVMHLRCSLIGPEGQGRRSLFFEWVRGLEYGASVEGFVNHYWNGLTSQTFGKIVAGIVSSGSFSPGVQHLVPAGSITKFELVNLELEMLERSDVWVLPLSTSSSVNRILVTENPEKNENLFVAAGYRNIPSIREMMEELPWEALRESTT